VHTQQYLFGSITCTRFSWIDRIFPNLHQSLWCKSFSPKHYYFLSY
jgi:hypothetical protein